VSAVILAALTVVGLQYARIIQRNVSLARVLSSINADIGSLRAARDDRLAHIRRLEDPQGAIPEVHDRLHMLRPGESIIYWKGGTPQPQATP
jgi:hypothetical protein